MIYGARAIEKLKNVARSALYFLREIISFAVVLKSGTGVPQSKEPAAQNCYFVAKTIADLFPNVLLGSCILWLIDKKMADCVKTVSLISILGGLIVQVAS